MGLNNSSKPHKAGPEMCASSCKVSLVCHFFLSLTQAKSNGAISRIFQQNGSDGSHQSSSAEDKSDRTLRGKTRTHARIHTQVGKVTQRHTCIYKAGLLSQWLVNTHAPTHVQTGWHFNGDRMRRDITSLCCRSRSWRTLHMVELGISLSLSFPQASNVLQKVSVFHRIDQYAKFYIGCLTYM